MCDIKANNQHHKRLMLVHGLKDLSLNYVRLIAILLDNCRELCIECQMTFDYVGSLASYTYLYLVLSYLKASLLDR